jgi:hypothetical protein
LGFTHVGCKQVPPGHGSDEDPSAAPDAEGIAPGSRARWRRSEAKRRESSDPTERAILDDLAITKHEAIGKSSANPFGRVFVE